MNHAAGEFDPPIDGDFAVEGLVIEGEDREFRVLARGAGCVHANVHGGRGIRAHGQGFENQVEVDIRRRGLKDDIRTHPRGVGVEGQGRKGQLTRESVVHQDTSPRHQEVAHFIQRCDGANRVVDPSGAAGPELGDRVREAAQVAAAGAFIEGSGLLEEQGSGGGGQEVALGIEGGRSEQEQVGVLGLDDAAPGRGRGRHEFDSGAEDHEGIEREVGGVGGEVQVVPVVLFEVNRVRGILAQAGTQ